MFYIFCQIPVVKSNVEEVAEATADVTSNTFDFVNTTRGEAESIESVAKTLENIVDVESTSVQVSRGFAKIPGQNFWRLTLA